MMYRLMKTPILTAIAATLLSANAWATGGDGEPPKVDDLRPHGSSEGCLEHPRWCPAYPASSGVDRVSLIRDLEHLAGCADDERHKEKLSFHDGSPSEVRLALASVVLSDPSTALHHKKIAIELLAELDDEETAGTFEAIYERSEDLARWSLADVDIPEEDHKKMIRLQAEELRRIVVLAAAKSSSKTSAALIQKALDDPGHSVATAAARLLEVKQR